MHYINSPKLSQTNPADFAGSLFYMYLPHKNVHIYMYPQSLSFAGDQNGVGGVGLGMG